MAVRARSGRWWQGLIGIAISIAFLYWALRGIPLSTVWRDVRSADLTLYVLSVVAVTLTFPVRTIRWRILLESSSGVEPPFLPVWHATAIGFMANNVLPARAGEVARGYAASRLVAVPMTTALGTIGVERIFDGLVLVFLLVLGVGASEFPDGARIGNSSLAGLSLAAGAAFAVLLLFLMVLVRAPVAVLAFADRWLTRLLPARASAWAMRAARQLIDGLSVLRSPRAFARVLTWSFVVWLLNAASYWLAFSSFHIAGLPVAAALVLQGVVALGVAVPSSPGFAGVFEVACVAALSLYGIHRDQAVSFALGLHMGWFIPITAIGLASLASTGLHLRDLRGPVAPE